MSRPDLAKISDTLAGAVEARVLKVVEEEADVDRLADLLSGVMAATEVARRAAEIERQILRTERDKDGLRARLNDASRDDANRMKERIDALDSRGSTLEAQRDSLARHLAALSDEIGS